jgi:predicted nucleic acid-binding protein
MDIVLLDTDVLSEILKQRHQNVVARAVDYLRSHGSFAFSAFTRFEISRGFREKGATNQLTRFKEFCRHSTIISVTDSVLDRAEELWVFARRGGHPVGDADLIIAATALETGRVLVTGNTAHYEWISGLALQNWRNR